MVVGTVKFFNKEKGFGFLSIPDEEDVYLHISDAQKAGFKTLSRRMKLEFDLAPNRNGNGLMAVRIREPQSEAR